MNSFVELHRGDPVPWFHQRNSDNPNYAVDSAAGRYLVLRFFGSAADEAARMAITSVMARVDLFDDRKCSFYGVSTDPADEAQTRVRERYPGYRYFWDFDLTISRLYGAAARTVSARIYIRPGRMGSRSEIAPTKSRAFACRSDLPIANPT